MNDMPPAIPPERPTTPNLFAASGAFAAAPISSAIELGDDDLLDDALAPVSSPSSARGIAAVAIHSQTRSRLWASD
jgi:hypothetical protein